MQRVEFGKLLNLKEDYIPMGRPNRPGTPNTLEYITIHNTDNRDPNADAASYSKFLRTEGYHLLRGEKIYSSWHYTVDDSRVLMHLPLSACAFLLGSAAMVGVPELIFGLVFAATLWVLVAAAAAADRRSRGGIPANLPMTATGASSARA